MTVSPAPPDPSAPAAPAARKPAWRSLLEVLGVLAVTGVLVLVLLEIGLRLFAPQIGTAVAGLFTPDPATRYRMQPNASVPFHVGEINVTYTTNAQGLREPGPVGPPAPHTTRVLAIGDSFTYGDGVTMQQAWPALLAGTAAPDGPVDPVNAGVPGYGTDQALAWLQTYGWPLQPRVVILGFYVGNDVRDNLLGMDKTEANAAGQLVETAATAQTIGRSPPTPGLKGWLERNSNAYVFLRNLLHPSNQVQTPGLYTSGPHEDVTFFLKDGLPGLAAGWDKTYALLDQMQAAVQAHGARLVVVAMPTRDQVEDQYWQEMKTLYGLQDTQLVRDLPQQKLAAWSAQSGATLVDLYPAFVRAAQSQTLYYHTDPHWNPAGHALAAQEIRAALVQDGIFGP